jgi:hypothetical protein
MRVELWAQTWQPLASLSVPGCLVRGAREELCVWGAMWREELLKRESICADPKPTAALKKTLALLQKPSF